MKFLKQRIWSRFMLFLLAMVLLLSIGPVPAAETSDKLIDNDVQEFAPRTYENYSKGELPLKELSMPTLPEFDRPEVVSLEAVKSNGHIKRLRELEEDLYTVVFQNSDGTNTMYTYAEAVKYVDETGEICDKSSNIIDSIDEPVYKKDYGYANEDNDIRTYFPKKLSDKTGIILEHEDICIELIPLSAKEQSTEELSPDATAKEQNTEELFLELEAKTSMPDINKIEDNILETKEIIDYANVFGSNITLRYTPTFSGFKEDIIIDSYNGINEFTFSVNTNGLSLINEYGQYFLVDPLTGERVVGLGDLHVYDSSVSEPETVTEEREPQTYNHSYDVQEIIPNEEYQITIIVDSEYLASEDTVYPVFVDPSFMIVEESIMDISVSEDGVVIRDEYCQIGISPYDGKMYRTFIKFPALLNNSLFQSLVPIGEGDGIYPEIREILLSMSSILPVFSEVRGEIYLYTGTDWNNDTVMFSSTDFDALGTQLDCREIDNREWTDFDLTSLALSNNLLQADKGIVIINSCLDSAKMFASTRCDYWGSPYITVSYIPVPGKDFDTAKTISLDSYEAVPVTAANQKCYYVFTVPKTGFYTFESSGNGSCDPYGWLYNASRVELDKNDDGAGSRNFRMTHHLESGTKYYIAAGCYSTGTGNYSFKITANTSLSNLSATTISTTTTASVSITASYQRRYFVFTAPVSGNYVFMSLNNNSSNPYGWLYNSNASLLSSNVSGGENRNFLINYNLTAGEKVYLVVGYSGGSIGNFSLNIVDPNRISHVTFANSEQTIIKPSSGSTSVTFTATVHDAAGNAITGLLPTYSLSQSPTGVSINSSTGVVTVTSSAAAPSTVSVIASCAGFTATATLNIAVTDPDLNISFDSAKTISTNTDMAVSVTAANQKRYYVFTAPKTGFYTFESSGSTGCDPYVWLYNASRVELDKNDDGAGSFNFQMIYYLEAGTKHYIAAGCYSTGTGSYSLKITANTSLSNLLAKTISTTTTESVSITASYQRRYFVFTAPLPGKYVFTSLDNNSSDPYGWLYDSNASLLSFNDDGGGNRNFKIEYNLAAGEKVYLVAGCYGTGTGSYSLNIVDPNRISHVTFANSEQTIIKPWSDSTRVTFRATARNANGDAIEWYFPVYSLGQSATGVSINSSTGVVTVTSSAAAPSTVSVVATCGSLTATATLKITVTSTTVSITKGDICYISVTDNGVSSFSGKTYKVTYNTTDLQIADLSAFTSAKETTTGVITGTGITIDSVSNGVISFTINPTNVPYYTIPSGKKWSGTVNVIAFTANRTGTTTLEIT